MLQLALTSQELETAGTENEGSDEDMEEAHEHQRPEKLKKPLLQPRPGELPADADVNAAQAESALGMNQCEDIDTDAPDDAEADTRAEKEALRGCEVNIAFGSHL